MNRTQARRNLRPSPAILLSSFLCLLPPAYTQKPPDPLALPAAQWAAQAAQNELPVLDYHAPYLRYRIHTRDSKGDQFRDVIQSRDGAVARLVWKDGHALTPDEDAAERQRLQAMLDSPDAFKKHIGSEDRGRKMAADIIHVLPDAMLYTYTPGQPQRPGALHTELVIDYEPNPSWTPPSMLTAGLTGLKGRAWIDPANRHMTRLEGQIFKGVNMGMGMLAHIYPGGQLSFDQVQLPNGRWIFSHFAEHLTIRALMVKTMKENTDIEGSLYTEVASMPYTDAVRLLLATPLLSRQP